MAGFRQRGLQETHGGAVALELGKAMRSRGTPRNHQLPQGPEAQGDLEFPYFPCYSLLAPGKNNMVYQMARL